MKKLLFFLIICFGLTSCVVSTRPMNTIYVKPIKMRHSWGPWGCYRPHYRPHYRHH